MKRKGALDYDLVVVGGGASGFFAAIHAAEKASDMRILILERGPKPLSKVRVSGGGRCNVTHHENRPSVFAQNYPRGSALMKQILHRFGQSDTVEWFEKHGLKLHAEADGRMFPLSNRSESVIEVLMNAAARFHITLQCSTRVTGFHKTTEGFVIQTLEHPISCHQLVLSCGGYPMLRDYQWIAEHGLNIIDPVPSLFTFNLKDEGIRQLMGLSTTAQIQIEGTKIRETGPLLATHWGISGPAVLRCSAWGARELAKKNYQFHPKIHWLPERNAETVFTDLEGLKKESPRKIKQRPFDAIPQRLWEYLLQRAGLPLEKTWQEIKNTDLRKLSEMLCGDRYTAAGKTTFKEEFVTAGGIDLKEIDARTFESKQIEGLYFTGELLDVDGITGGFNFQFAWSSGAIAGKALGEKWKNRPL